MNIAHLHLLLNHFPILGSIFGTVILGVGLLLKRTDMKRIGLAFFIFAGLAIIPVVLTGDGAGEVLKNHHVEQGNLTSIHEEYGETLVWTCIALGLLSLFAFYLEVTQKSFARMVMIGILVLSIANGYLLKLTGTSGGQIRHTELRDSVAISPASNAEKKIVDNDGSH